MKPLIFSVLIGSIGTIGGRLHATEISIDVTCQARCMILQTGREAQREIAAIPREYASKTRLVNHGKRISAGSVEELQSTCDEIARGINWWHPATDIVEGRLVSDIDVDTTDDVLAVRSWTEITECVRLTSGYEFGDKFAPAPMDAIERTLK